MIRKLLNNWRIKLLALALGALTYYLVHGKTSVEMRFEIPLSVQVESDLAVVEQNPRTVFATFRGSQEDLRRLDQEQPKATVRLKTSNITSFEEVRVRRTDIAAIRGVTVVEVYPAKATVVLDRRMEKRVVVGRPVIRGRPLDGRAEADHEPKTVVLRGPRRRIQNAEAFAEPVDVEGRADSFTQKVRVLTSDPWITEIEPPEVTVKVNVVRGSALRVVENLPVFPLCEAAAAARATPDRVTVRLRGRVSSLDAVAGGSIRVFVDCVGLKRDGVYDLPVIAHVPAQSDLEVECVPPTVKVTLGAE